MRTKFPLFDIYWDKSDVENVSNIIKRGSYWAVGPEIKEFEKKISEFFNCKYALAFCNGTAALHSLLLAYGITSGEVIVPSFTFIATANAVILAGATPIFADIEDETLGLDPVDVERKITSKTKAIIPVHYGGKVCKNIHKLKDIAVKNNLLLIEDNAESFGAKIDNFYAGTIGDSAILSFCQNKILPTGEGGAIITNDQDLYEKLILIRSHGRVEQKNIDYFSDIHMEDYVQVGYNYRMPTICAALGISQLEKIEFLIKKRRKIGNYYDKNLKDISEIEILPEYFGSRNVYQLYSILVKDPFVREELQDYLMKRNIFTKIYFAPIHLKSYYKLKYKYSEGYLPVTEKISKKILTLPISLTFSEEEQNYIIDSIKEFFLKK
ncbi:UDP-4-amino-4-deoxy-L-arabinose--oxoglutarate aminotransferase [Candidatus Lokiarchaeum ossiferum]|uniref:UDP-4-amino-4-deoxy-L-arabinose--oxoglutarate aminotransferase n=1 Tax=Candidatus Lokiarchaeum ossiferum TaxID=2951803 RepID=A0ABY6HXE5_9ARCH|nr:UDP-4-amino-4-deoxy-L-arabinose--oxoglutarate aminotransferase [Candidatus Lokiarchaeum sp. B-35]